MSARIQQRRSRIHGNGVFAIAPIHAGEKVVEYKGLLRTHEEADALYGDSIDSGHTFLFTLNEHYLIDANVKGNVARWLNHSCEPNCQAFLVESSDGNPRKDRVVIEALRDITAGEELTYNYGIRLSVAHTPRLKKRWACLCGADQCSGTLLQPKR
ncbi:MAG: SET domain-containing protein [Dechloromonas sp.]|nr:MAG: SET domain-containing protein [Dechloromonas sp.]